MKKHQKEDIMNIKEKLASASKKERTPQQQKAMTILNWVATAVCIVVIVFALVVAIFTIAGTTNDDHLMRFGDKIYLNVASDSMEPTFSTSDVIIANAFNYEKQLAELKVGQVVTFKTTVRSGGNTYEVFNTHRIVRINFEENGTTVRNFTTRGDNSKSADKDNSKLSWKDAIAQNTLGLTETVAPSNIVATWGSVDADGNFTSGKMLKGVGGFSNWIQDTANFGAQQKTRFFCVVVLPLILLFVIYAFILVRTLVIANSKINARCNPSKSSRWTASPTRKNAVLPKSTWRLCRRRQAVIRPIQKPMTLKPTKLQPTIRTVRTSATTMQARINPNKQF